MVKALGEIVKIVSGLEKKSKSSDCYYQHQILFFNSLTTYHFFYLLLYTPYIFFTSYGKKAAFSDFIILSFANNLSFNVETSKYEA